MMDPMQLRRAQMQAALSKDRTADRAVVAEAAAIKQRQLEEQARPAAPVTDTLPIHLL